MSTDIIIPAGIAPISNAILDSYNRGYLSISDKFTYGFLLHKDDDNYKTLTDTLGGKGYEKVDEDTIVYTVEIDLKDSKDIYKKYTMGVKGTISKIAFITPVYTPNILSIIYPDRVIVTVLPIYELEPLEGSRIEFIRNLLCGGEICGLKSKPVEFLNVIEQSLGNIVGLYGGIDELAKEITTNGEALRNIMELLMDAFCFSYSSLAKLPFNDMPFIPLMTIEPVKKK